MSGEKKSEVRKKKKKEKEGRKCGFSFVWREQRRQWQQGLLEQTILVAGGRRRRSKVFRADSRAWDLKGCRHVCRARMSNMRSWGRDLVGALRVHSLLAVISLW
jgi:hypothetical protein